VEKIENYPAAYAKRGLKYKLDFSSGRSGFLVCVIIFPLFFAIKLYIRVKSIIEKK